MKLISILFFILIFKPCFSQETPPSQTIENAVSSITVEDSDLLKLQLPTIQTLLDSAVVHAPSYKYYQLRKEEEECRYKSANREWMKYISMDSYYKYGKLGLASTNTDSNTQVIDAYSSQSQHWYQIGIGFDFPLLEFVDRKNKKNIQKIKVEQATAEANRMGEEAKVKVIEQYNNAIMHLELLKAKAELLALNDVQYFMTEKNFIKGKIDIAELSRLKQLQVNAKIEYEMTKSQYRSSLMILETLTGINIINK